MQKTANDDIPLPPQPLLPSFTALLAAGDLEGYGRELCSQGVGWVQHFQFPLLAAHFFPLRRFPPLKSPPPRIQLLTLAVSPGTPSTLSDLEALYHLFLLDGDEEATGVCIGIALQSIIDSGHAFHRFQPWRERAEKFLRKDSPSPLVRAFLALFQVWAEIMGPGHLASAGVLLEPMRQNAEQAQSPSLIVFHAALVAYISFWRGDLSALEIVLADVKPFAEDPHTSPLAVLHYRSAFALLKTLQGAPEEGRRIYCDLLKHPMLEVVSPGLWLQVLGNYLYTVATLSDQKEAERIGVLLLARTVPEYNHYYHSYLHFNLAIVSLVRGRPQKALNHAFECRRYGELCESSNVARMSALVIGQALMELDRDEEALDHFRIWLPRWKKAEYWIIAVLGAIEMAYILLRLGRIDPARDALRTARAMVPKNERIATLYRPGDYACRLEEMLFPEQMLAERARKTPITITTLGVFSVTIHGGKTLTDKNWHGSKAKKLLQTIIALGGSRVSTEQLAYMLWPDANGDLAMNAFKVTLSRLRATLAGGDKEIRRSILVVKQKRITLSSRLCSVDAFVFMDFVHRAGTPVLQSDAMAAALAMYSGNFLEASADYWIISAGENLRERFIQATLQLCDSLATGRDIERTIPLLSRAMEFDPVNEAVCARLMQAHLHLGNRVKSLDIYNKISKDLERQRGIGPGPMLRHLYLQMQKN